MKRLVPLALLVLIAAAAWVVATRVRLSPDVGPLLPDRGEAAALGAYARAFGGGDPGLVLIEGDDPEEVRLTAADAIARLAPLGPARDRVSIDEALLTPSRWLLLADPPLAAALGRWLTPDGMRARLSETRALLLAPGSAALVPQIARDPLRLGQAVAEHRAGAQTRGDGELATRDGRARLVVVDPSGSSLHSQDARRFVADAEAALGLVRAGHPSTRVRLTGGHALAASTEALLRSDLERSAGWSLLLSSLAFVALQRRPRALLAVLPPLAAGTVLAASVGAFFANGVAGVAVAFVSVALGVGMDTGVHVHAAVREAVARGSAAPVEDALGRVSRPVLGAALVAASAFGCLALSRVEALRQLGLLAAAGELATAVCIWAFSPWLSWLLERHGAAIPAPPRWAHALAALSGWPRLRAVSLVALAATLLALLVGGLPSTDAGLLAIRPEGLAPQQVYADIAARFGSSDQVPWVVLVRDRDEESARTRADRLHDALVAHPTVAGSLESMTPWAPSATTLSERRRALADLPARADDLRAALREQGLAPQRFEAAIDDLARPAETLPVVPGLERRFVGRDGADTLVRIEARAPDREALAALVRRVDPRAEVTGWGALEPALRGTLRADLPRVGGAAALLLVASLTLAVRRARDVALAATVVAAELALVLVAMRLLSIPLHLYDALVLPVLLGVTVDEVLFVLWAVRRGQDPAEAIAHEAPLVAATALTTAAGFTALLGCQFAPLRHLGAVAALGSVTGLLLALLVVPAWAQKGTREGGNTRTS